MGSSIRNLVQRKVVQNLRSTTTSKVSEIASNLYLNYDATAGSFIFNLPLKTKRYDIQNDAEILAKDSRDIFSDITLKTEGNHPSIAFRIPRDSLVKEILESNAKGPSPPLHISPKKQNIVIDFSSPNIAKPFHVGHLRSTIIGNYIANLHNFLHDKVRKINYLGDWGTQFGYVQLGINLLNVTDEAMRLDPIGELYRAYVYANKLAENDLSIAKRAREIFENLEKGDQSSSQKWQTFREYTISELKKTYARLGVNFDEYHWESMYASRDIVDVIERMDKLNLLTIDQENRRVVAVNESRNVPLIKSDGSTLYLTRDIAAAIDRFDKYNFDLMYYVVDNGQSDHFANLATILRKMEMPWAERLRHVKFGKIRGISTRKGSTVFLRDVLDEARDAMREKQTQTTKCKEKTIGTTLTDKFHDNSPATKVSLDPNDSSSDSLGMAAVIIHDLKRKRQRDYDFNWNVALDIKGETGVKLQYTHCRLANLEENSGVTLPNECDPSLLREPVVNALVAEIIQFDEAIISSYRTLEPCYLAKYLFELSHVVNKTLKELRVKDEPSDVASQRLLLYRVAKNVLAQGMRLLGLQPLDKM